MIQFGGGVGGQVFPSNLNIITGRSVELGTISMQPFELQRRWWTANVELKYMHEDWIFDYAWKNMTLKGCLNFSAWGRNCKAFNSLTGFAHYWVVGWEVCVCWGGCRVVGVQGVEGGGCWICYHSKKRRKKSLNQALTVVLTTLVRLTHGLQWSTISSTDLHSGCFCYVAQAGAGDAASHWH